jgi:alanyl-tRNA synthetase
MNRKNKHLLKQVAVTTDGKKVLSGLYKFYETVGLPLDVLLHCFQEKNALPDWVDFYTSALAAGMEHERILSKLEEAVSDSFGKEFSDHVISTLGKIFKP